MKKTLSLLVLLLSLTALNTKAQFANQITSPNWDLVGSIDFRDVSETEYYPIFNNKVKALVGKPFELEGYMVPIREEPKQVKFLLATLPVYQCNFCGKDGIPIMVMIEMATPTVYNEKIVKIRGTVKLNAGNAASNMPFTLAAAKLVP